jgi:hypothetical protein
MRGDCHGQVKRVELVTLIYSPNNDLEILGERDEAPSQFYSSI